MKSDKTGRIITILYCIAAGIVSISTLVEFIVKYSSFGAQVPVYLYPWGGAWGVGDKSLFYVFRMPVMAVCLQAMILGLYPDRMEDWSDDAYSYLRLTLMGLSLIVMSQLSINAYISFNESASMVLQILMCALLVMGIITTVFGYIRLRGVLKPMCTSTQSPMSLLIDFIFKGCKRRRVLLIAATAAFMILLVIPSLSL